MITHNQIYGWFDTNAEKFYSMIIDKFPAGSHLVEIGAYMGMSTCFMAQEMKRKNKLMRFDVVDHFKGSSEHQSFLQGKNLLQIFMTNMKNAEVLDVIHITPLDLNLALDLYDDESIEFVFIDADHSYECVKSDITKWIKKVKIGGIISGDDYFKTHPGVIKAVDEFFPKEKVNFIGRNWYVVKE